jgi:hypothetical protein
LQLNSEQERLESEYRSGWKASRRDCTESKSSRTTSWRDFTESKKQLNSELEKQSVKK